MSSLISYEDLSDLFASGNIPLDTDAYSRLALYADLLVEWNKKMNLTAITDPSGIALKHFYDSLYPFTLLELPLSASIIDVGTGAGFPGIPLKILRPDLRLTLLDSLNKRVTFLKEVSTLCSLNAECIHSRAEEAGRSPLRETFDIATARAVADLSVLCEYCLPFVKQGGSFIALKGKNGSKELSSAQNAIKPLGGTLSACTEYTLPNGDARTLIVIRKTSPTPAKYPRPTAQMKKNPL